MRKSSASKKYQLDLGSFDDEDQTKILPHTSLTWRGDPKDTISDWTIIVKGKANNNHTDNYTRRTTNKNTNRKEDEEEEEEGDESDTIILGTYHVHKGVLAAGTWRSTYFEALFKNQALGSLRENTTRTSVVELEPLAAAAVPMMLDHVYFGTETFDEYNDQPTTTTATTTTTGTSTVALRWLAKYFGIRTLFAAATAEIDRDLTVDTAIRYLEESIVFRDDKIISAVVHVCASNIHLLTDAHWTAFSPTVFRGVVLGSVRGGSGGGSDGSDGEDGTSMDSEDLSMSGHHLTRVVANYCRLHPEVVDNVLLESVMGEETIASIAPDECLFLLSLCLAHNPRNGDRTKTHSDAGTLMDRTMEICKTHWEEVLSDTPLLLSSATTTNTTTNTITTNNSYIEQPNEENSDDGNARPKHDYYSEFPDETKVKMLEGALQTAKRELDDTRRRIKDLYVDVGSEKEHARKLRAALDFTTKCLKDGDSIARGGRKRKDKKTDRKKHK